MPAEARLHEGKVDEALAELQKAVRSDPSNVKHRIFLFQLLAIQGDWSRALTQLEVVGELETSALAMVQAYREGLRCEMFRAEVFSGKRSPLIFGQPDEWMALLIEALKLTAEGRHVPAREMRARALEAAPATPGRIELAPDPAAHVPPPDGGGSHENTPEFPGEAFEWIADADSRLGPVLEAVVNGRYYWIPFYRIREIRLDRPTDLRDLVWTPAHFIWANGGASVGFIPTRYPGSEGAADGRIRLARRTEWSQADAETFLGLGQRVFVTDVSEHSILDVVSVHPDPGTPLDADVSSAGLDGAMD
jgi:type VI secretion system protein ImpE